MLTGGYHSVRPTPKGELAGEAFFIGGNMLTQERLKELFNYDPDTGKFTRRDCGRTWKAGSVAGSLNKTLNYFYIEIDRKKYKASRLAWLYVYGEMPKNDIDHINRIRTDDRIENLRDVTKSYNMKNCAVKKSNTSGFLGVSFCKDIKKWRARIKKDGKVLSLGCFVNPEDAHNEYKKASIALYPEIHGGFNEAEL